MSRVAPFSKYSQQQKKPGKKLKNEKAAERGKERANKPVLLACTKGVLRWGDNTAEQKN